MTMRSKLALGLAAGALVIGSVSPAAARGYDGRWRHRHHDDGPSAGAIFGVLLGVGVIAAIASANAKKNKEAQQQRYDPRYGDRGYDDRGYDSRGYDDRDYGRSDEGRNYDGRSNDRNYGNSQGYASEDEAVDACATAARDQAGGFAEVRGITDVRPFGNGFDVTGTIDQRSSYRANDRRTRSFRCTFDNGRVAGVSFGTGV